MKKRCFHCFLLLLISVKALSQQSFSFKTYSFPQGLKSYHIYKTLQDNYGFIWIATQDGLFRFNGRSFEYIKNNIGNANVTMGNVFIDLTKGQNEEIFVADYFYGIDIINSNNWKVNYIGLTNSGRQKKLPNYWIEKIYVDDNENLWVGGKGYFAFKRTNDTAFTVVDVLPGLTREIKVNCINAVGKNKVVVSVDGLGLLFYDAITLKQLNTQYTTATGDFCLYKDTIYTTVSGNVIKAVLNNNSLATVMQTAAPALIGKVSNSITHDNNNRLWIGTNNGLVFYDLLTQKATLLNADKIKANWLKDNMINHVMIDNQNNLWISGYNVLQMLSLSESGFKVFDGNRVGSDPMNHIYTITPKSSTELFCTGTDGLYITNIEKNEVKKIPGTSIYGLIHHIEHIKDNKWIVSSDKGMLLYNETTNTLSGEKLLNEFPEWATYQKNYFNTAVKNDLVYYWASEEEEGVLKWEPEKHSIAQFKAGTNHSAGLQENHIRNIKRDREGFLWVLSDVTLSKFDATKDTVTEVLHVNVQANGPNAILYFDMYDDGNTYWFASYGAGVCGYDNKSKQWRFINEQNGLSNNCVYGLLPESDSVFWASTNMGLSRVNYFTKNCSNYYYEDGLQDNSFDEKGALAFNGKLYFGGVNGFTEVDTKKINNNIYTFPVYITRVEYQENNNIVSLRNLEWSELTLPAGTNKISIDLAAVTFNSNHKIKFSYRIDGVQNNFTGIDDNKLTLNTLDYGTYKIIFRYRKEDGSYIDNALSLSIYINPRWYQTWWFKALIAALVIVVFYAFYRYRINQINKQQKIRKSIATDLHDDLGSTLNSVKIFTNLAISGVKQEENLQQVKDNLTEATMSLRDMIWVLDDSLDTVEELVTRLKQFANPVAAASNIEATIKADAVVTTHKLTKEEKRNLFLICKEAINNTIKYSSATQIIVSIKPNGKKIQITLADNGKGFNVNEVKKGYGLKNMQYRAAQIGYSITITSLTGNGAQIEIK